MERASLTCPGGSQWMNWAMFMSQIGEMTEFRSSLLTESLSLRLASRVAEMAS